MTTPRKTKLAAIEKEATLALNLVTDARRLHEFMRDKESLLVLQDAIKLLELAYAKLSKLRGELRQ